MAAPNSLSQPVATTDQALQAKLDEAAWRAVERIDAKLANAVLLMTFFVGLIAIVLGLYEFFKVREVERIRNDLKKSIQSLFDERFEASNHEYQRRLARRLLEQVETHTNRIADDQIRLAAVRHRIMLCYVTNDLNPRMEEPMTVSNMHSCIEMERALNQLDASSPKDNLMALSLIKSFAQRVSDMTAGQILIYLVITKKSGSLYTWDNQELCNDIIRILERKTGISAADIAFD